MGLLEGKVAIITGSGGGIGRAHALAFAKEGAKVVVNDLGKDRTGSGDPTPMAETVANEIKSLGGQAVANMDNIATMAGGKNLVDAAVKAFGGLDILVNNAGILRDKTLLKMEEDQWDSVISVHLKGHFACTQAAAMAMKDQGRGGRIINTSSYSGLIGNFGQANYAAAKAGVYGFTRVCALEFQRLGITCNAIAPVAYTRMTEDLGMFQSAKDALPPEAISPIVVFLASDLAKEITGKVFGVQGNRIYTYTMKEYHGASKPEDQGLWTPQEIAQRMAEICSEAVESPRLMG